MDISRNNYEEYFLLYADNELTDSEKAEVLMFLKDNKDLEEEFRMLHHTICKPETNIELADKTFLLKGNEASFIHEENYEEVFVLYHDNELTGSQKKETEDFLARHAELRNEFELIGMAKLTPDDAVTFYNKKRLYRREKTGRVVPLFWKALVAAVFVGAGLWITQEYIQKESKKPAVAIQSNSSIQPAPVIEKAPPGNKAVNNRKAVNNIAQSPARDSKRFLSGVPTEKQKMQKRLQQNDTSALVKTSLKVQKPGGHLIKPAEEINREDNVNNEVPRAEVATKNIPEEQVTAGKTEPLKEVAENAIPTGELAQPQQYTPNASYVSDVNDNSQNYVFYDITTDEFKKTKVSGFLKKVKRVIERNNPITRLLSGNEKQVVSN